jgi:outer membrane protein assembly factor BamD
VGLAARAELRAHLAVGVACCALLPACASGTLDLEKLSSPSDKIVWDAAKEALEDRDFESARQYLRRIIDAFPQSQYQPEARIALADSYLDEGGPGNAILAVSAYREFLTLYPSAPRAAYAQFRAAEAYFGQMNSPDRDQTPTLQALDEYQRLLNIYPNSEYVEPARERIQQCRQTLARSEFLIGYFYQRTREAWLAAIGRYERVLREYPDYEELDEVLYRLGEALAAAARYNEARPVLDRLEREYPDSKWVPEARELRAEMPEMPEAAPEAASASTGEAEEPADSSTVEGPQPQG